MKKTFISAALVVAIGVGGYMGFHANSSSSDQLSDIMLANVEAIASSEDPFISLCNSNCNDYIGETCVLITNYGFEIKCHDMVRKY